MKQSKQMVLVASEEISLYDLIDGRTPEEIKVHLDALMNKYIVHIREGCELRFDIGTYYDDVTLTLNLHRKETDEEYAKRKAENQRAKDKAKACRFKEYLRLKSEFEGENNGL